MQDRPSIGSSYVVQRFGATIYQIWIRRLFMRTVLLVSHTMGYLQNITGFEFLLWCFNDCNIYFDFRKMYFQCRLLKLLKENTWGLNIALE